MTTNIQNGIYVLTNVEATNICLEILGPERGYSVVGKEFRNHENQKWLLHRDSDGIYAIYSLPLSLFLNTAIDPEYGARLVGTPFTFWWGIESEPGFEDTFRLCVPHTCLDVEFANNGCFMPDSPATLGERSEDHNQLWRLQKFAW
ncbi:hypothetical protein F5J12DRAFT_869468 [Pisolithus orientalis]|uniref:uncharacterized protein n=1 Tax=Pisolithus orientalis TaxID=936130 RepID=UPI0022248B7B|nr:uncharacterized protein F5J12DRAFT_869468 [Pisolithus orientalis]KAI5985442.1 hypothetical protein F5J12DRAFT_869468 [Pisolithus orientalis]